MSTVPARHHWKIWEPLLGMNLRWTKPTKQISSLYTIIKSADNGCFYKKIDEQLQKLTSSHYYLDREMPSKILIIKYFLIINSFYKLKIFLKFKL